MHTQCHLHLGQDHPEVRNRDDVTPRVFACEVLHCCVDTVCGFIPAFATRWCVRAGGFPIGA